MQWCKCAKPESRRCWRNCAYRNSLNALERIIRRECMNCTCSCDKGHWAKGKGTVRHPVCLGLPVCHTACTKHISPLSKQHTLPELCFTYAQLHSALEAVVTLKVAPYHMTLVHATCCYRLLADRENPHPAGTRSSRASFCVCRNGPQPISFCHMIVNDSS